MELKRTGRLRVGFLAGVLLLVLLSACTKLFPLEKKDVELSTRGGREMPEWEPSPEGDNFLARFAERNLVSWSVDGGAFCDVTPTLGNMSRMNPNPPELRDEQFGTLFAHDSAFARWRMPVEGVKGAKWAVPTREEMEQIFTDPAGRRVHAGLSYYAKKINGVWHLLRYQVKEGAGLEVRARLSRHGGEPFREEDFWNRDDPREVVRCFPYLGLYSQHKATEELTNRGHWGEYWTSSHGPSKTPVVASCRPDGIDLGVGPSDSDRHEYMAIRPIMRRE